MRSKTDTAVLDAYKVAGGLFVPLVAEGKTVAAGLRNGLRFVVEVKPAPRKKDAIGASFGLLKGRFPDAMEVQRALRQEWDR